jgi:hypothetical protein
MLRPSPPATACAPKRAGRGRGGALGGGRVRLLLQSQSAAGICTASHVQRGRVQPTPFAFRVSVRTCINQSPSTGARAPPRRHAHTGTHAHSHARHIRRQPLGLHLHADHTRMRLLTHARPGMHRCTPGTHMRTVAHAVADWAVDSCT